MLKLYAKSKLKEVREAKYTQEEMMKLLEIQLNQPFPRSTYTHKENGSYSFSAEEAVAVSRILKVDLDEVFEKRDNQQEGEVQQ